MFNDRSSLQSFLATRRSARPRDLVEPGPSEDELQRILALATRTPDHGKLNPWRFVHVPRDARAAFAALLALAYRDDREEPGRLELESIERFAHQAPELVVVLFSPKSTAKIPLWEQELSCGAACFNLLLAASAFGYDGGWVTGWPTYSARLTRAFGQPDDKIAGFVFLGTSGVPLEERPRPAADEVISRWQPAAP